MFRTWKYFGNFASLFELKNRNAEMPAGIFRVSAGPYQYDMTAKTGMTPSRGRGNVTGFKCHYSENIHLPGRGNLNDGIGGRCILPWEYAIT